MTTTVDITALVAMLRQIQCEPASFDTYSMASAAERAADAIERLQLSAIDDQEICRRGDEIILELDRKLAAAQSSLTASGEALKRARKHVAAARGNASIASWAEINADLEAIDAAMAKANGDPLKPALEAMYGSKDV